MDQKAKKQALQPLIPVPPSTVRQSDSMMFDPEKTVIGRRTIRKIQLMKSLEKGYQGHGISFQYPPGWELSEEPRDDAITISVSEMGTFWSVTVLHHRPPQEHVLAEAVGTFRNEYEDLDEYPVDAVINGQPTAARNLEFMALELISCVFLRTLEVGNRTLFVMAQVTDHERSEYEEIFQEISDSLSCDHQDEMETD